MKPFHLFAEIRFDNCQWSFVHRAGDTINTLRRLHQLGPGVAEMVDQVCDHIRGDGLASTHPDMSG